MSEATTSRVGYLIKRAQSALHDAMVDALGPHGLTVTQFAVLAALDEEPGLSNADLARRAFVTPQSMHAVLQELERREFVVRRPHPQHQRVLQAALTVAGRRTLKSAGNGVNAVEEQMLHKLPVPVRSRLASALSSCIDSLTETPTSSALVDPGDTRNRQKRALASMWSKRAVPIVPLLTQLSRTRVTRSASRRWTNR